MAKSRSELPLRGSEGDEAISNDSPREREQCPARVEKALPYFLALEGRGLR
jgi:hypothetical protein